MRLLFRSSVLYLLLCASCTKPLPVLDGVDLEQWKNDRNGCNGTRSGYAAALKSQRRKLEGLTESQVSSLLGRPDLNELYKRNQKFYHYYLDPGPECTGHKDQPLQLIVRFNAMERAKEIAVE